MAAKKILAQALQLILPALLAAGCTPAGPRAMLKGRDLLDAGEATAAVVQFQRATSLMVSNAGAWNYLGLAAHRAGRAVDSFNAYQHAIQLEPNFAEARFNLGCLLEDQGRPDLARDAFAAATVLRPRFPEAWLRRARCELQLKESAAAETSLRELLQLQPRNVEALNTLGLVQLQRNRPREAAGQFSSALAIQPDYRPALLNLAIVTQQHLNDRPAATALYQRYLALTPRPPDWEAVNALVQSLQPAAPPAAPAQPPATGEAKPTATAARPPTNPRSEPLPVEPSPKPTVIASTNAPAAAPADIVRLTPEPVIRTTPVDVSSNPSSPPRSTTVTPAPPTATQTATTNPPAEKRTFLSRVNPANLFRREASPEARLTPLPDEPPTGNSPPAVSAPRPSGFPVYAYLSPTRPTTGSPRECERLLAQGRREQDAQKYNEALQSYRAAVAADPGSFDAQFALGYAAYQVRSYKLSTWAWEHALAIHPDSVDARYNFALALRALNHIPEAAAELEKLLRADDKVTKAHLTLGNIYAEQLKNVDRARLHYRRVLDLEPSHPRGAEIRQWLVNNKP